MKRGTPLSIKNESGCKNGIGNRGKLYRNDDNSG